MSVFAPALLLQMLLWWWHFSSLLEWPEDSETKPWLCMWRRAWNTAFLPFRVVFKLYNWPWA